MATTYYVDDGLEIVEEKNLTLSQVMDKYRALDARERGIHGVPTERVTYTFSVSENALLTKVADLTIEVVPEADFEGDFEDLFDANTPEF